MQSAVPDMECSHSLVQDSSRRCHCQFYLTSLVVRFTSAALYEILSVGEIQLWDSQNRKGPQSPFVQFPVLRHFHGHHHIITEMMEDLSSPATKSLVSTGVPRKAWK